jgi:putative endonuclease
MKTSSWHFYILLCNDGSYYAGVTTNIDRRLHEHNKTKRGAKYTRPRRPVRLIMLEGYSSRSTALKAEARFKALSRSDKEAYISEGYKKNE